MKAGTILMAICLAAVSLSAGAAHLYQWKDVQGRTVYSDQPPPPNIKNAQQKAFKGNVIEIGESYDARTAREKFPVYSSSAATGSMVSKPGSGRLRSIVRAIPNRPRAASRRPPPHRRLHHSPHPPRLTPKPLLSEPAAVKRLP